MTSGSEWWARWSTSTEPNLTTEVVLARGVGDLDIAMRRPGVVTVGGPCGANEILACVVAAAVKTGEGLLDRVVVVDDRNAWQRLLKEDGPLILVASDPDFAEVVGRESPHTAVVAIPQSEEADVVLELSDSERVAEALRKLNDNLPYELGPLARRSFVSFRRRLAQRPELMTPPWATGPIPRVVRTALLVTDWSDGNEADRDVVTALAGIPYDSAREELLAYTVGDDPLLALTTDRWLLVSPADAWQQLARHLLTGDLKRFVKHATAALSERDPSLDLPRDQRWRASLENKVLRHFGFLRRGIATGLALLGTYGDRVVSATGVHGEHWAVQALRPLFDAANADRTGERWASFAALLPLLMEAAPGELFAALRSGTAGDSPVLAPQEDSLFGPDSPHTPFLWALETAAWSRDYVGDAAEVLAALVTLDPGGRLSNRPSASLANIFCPWHPDTAADVDQRLAILDRLNRRWPAVAYSLMVELLPEAPGIIHFPTHEPDFRDWKPSPYVVLVTDCWRFVEGVLARLLRSAEADAGRWSALFDAHQHLPPALREKVRQEAEQLEPDRFDAAARRSLWENLRKLVAHHREFSDAEWALPAGELTLLDALATKFESASPADRFKWLFMSPWVELGDVNRRDDYRAYDREVADRRAAAIKDLVAEDGFDGLAAFAANADAGVVGLALGDALPDDETLDRMLSWYELGSDTERMVSANYLWRLGRLGGLRWVLEVLQTHPGLRPSTQAELLYDAFDVPEAWDEARARGGEVEREYWLRFSYVGRGEDFPFVLHAADRLIAVGRAAAALDMLAMYQGRYKVDAAYAEAVARALEELLERSANDPEIGRLQRWDYERAFAVLDVHIDVVGRSRVARLQWNFLPALGYDPPTTSLHRALAEDPGFFVEILRLVSRPKADPDAPAEVAANPAASQNAYRLLKTWSVPPGRAADGTFDSGGCRRWIHEARLLLEDADRLELGMEQIGEVLVFTPGGEDGWPSSEVADLLEELDDDSLDHGMGIGLMNKRGMTSRSPTEGGEQERLIAADFRRRAKLFRDSHPRVARILNRMAETYEVDARREDREAERRRRGLE